jgi:predicted TPR repeat methyltransferase
MTENSNDVVVLLAANKYQEALLAANTLCDREPEEAEHWFLLAGVHAQMGALVNVEKCCRRVLDLDPEHARARYNLAVALEQSGRLSEAVEVFRVCAARNPGHLPTLTALARLLTAEHEPDETGVGGGNSELETILRKILSLKPDHVESLNNLARLLDKAGRRGEAVQYLVRVAALQPERASSHYNLGLELTILGRGAEAEPYLRKSVDLDPGNAGFWITRGDALAQIGQHQEALHSYQQAASLDPDNMIAYNQIGSCHIALGQRDAAIAALQTVLAKDPENESANYILPALGVGQMPERMAPEAVAKLFDQYAEHFDKHLAERLEYRTPGLLREVLTPMLGAPSQRLSILDLGCGTGLCGPLFKPWARRLTGVDLAPRMIEKASERAVYDELIVADVTEALLRQDPKSLDLIVAADVFVYIGDLSAIFRACGVTLTANGLFAFSIERHEGSEPYILRTTGRFAHSLDYVRKLGKEYGLHFLKSENCTLRKDANKPIPGSMFVFALTGK